MFKTRSILFALLLAGCGGGGAAYIQGNVGSVAMTFVAGTDYNGVADPMSVYTSLDGSSAGNIATVAVANGARALDVSAISTGLASGAVIDLAGTTGSTVTYIDANGGHWTATSGTITVQSRTSVAVQLLLTNVVLANPTNGGAGSVTASGAVTFNATAT